MRRLIINIGANKNGKRTAVAYLYSNIISVVFWLGFAYLAGGILKSVGICDIFAWANTTSIDMFSIAIVNTIYKVLAVALTLPITNLLVRMANATVKGDDKKGDEYTAMLDDRLLDTPSIAIENAHKVANRMAELSFLALHKSIALLDEYDEKRAQEIRNIEDKVDIYEDTLGSYLIKLSSKNMSEKDSADVTKILHIIGDFERLSDHAVNLTESAEEIREKNISFSAAAVSEMDVLKQAVSEILLISERAFIHTDFHMATTVEPLEELIDDLRDQIKLRHTIRLQKSLCSIELGFILSDILTNLERVSDHCSNIAGCVLDMAKTDMHLHESIRAIRADETHFKQGYDAYAQRYALPIMPD
jgi:phosphate:Na+ symporter